MATHPLLKLTKHRSEALPLHRWKYYQEWNRVLFLHWAVPLAELRKLVPEELVIDTYEGVAYVSLVAFSMEKVRPRLLPSVHFLSNFDEINVRTYINQSGKQGVYFLNIEAANRLVSLVAKSLSGLPYEAANLSLGAGKFEARNKKKNFNLSVDFEVDCGRPIQKSPLDHWLTERYCLFLQEGSKNFCYDVHHIEWPLCTVHIKQLELHYRFGSLMFDTPPDLVHYSPGVQVLAWPKFPILRSKENAPINT